MLDLTSLNNFHAESGSHYTVLIAFRGISGFFNNALDTLNTSGLTRADVMAPNGVVVAYLPSGHGVLTLRSTVAIPDNNPCDVDPVLVSGLAPNASQLAAPFDVWFSLAQQSRFNLQNHFDDILAAPAPTPVPPPTPPEEKGGVGKAVIEGKQPLPPSPAPEKRWNVWATGFGDWVNIDSEGSTAKGYDYTNAGFTAGIDYRLSDICVLGAMGGYAHTWTDLKPGSVDIDTGFGGLYFGLFNLKGFYLLGAAYGGGGSFDTSRPDVLGGRANGSSNTQQWSTFFTAGWDWHYGGLVIGPTASVQYSYVDLSSFTERGSITDLSVKERSAESIRSDVGFRAWYSFQAGKVQLRPFVRAVWNHEYRENQHPIGVSLIHIQSSSPVTVSGPSLGGDSCIVNAGVSAQITPTISTYVSYDGQLGRNNFDYNGVSGGFNISF
jgi:uncharacterized protein YhjY with autotransporter beta-barrel domain